MVPNVLNCEFPKPFITVVLELFFIKFVLLARLFFAKLFVAPVSINALILCPATYTSTINRSSGNNLAILTKLL